MKKIITIIGARPQIIKAAAISRAINRHFSTDLNERIVHTGQHYDENMSATFFNEMGIPLPDYQLNAGSGSHGLQTARMLEAIEKVLITEQPNGVLVYGDTNSTLAAAIAASKMHIPVIHVEAGLRSFNKSMPEEINRIACDHTSTLMFCPTEVAITNLKHEGFDTSSSKPYSIDKPGIYHCGDVMYDNALWFAQKAEDKRKWMQDQGLEEGKFILATIHRDHNTDDPEKLGGIFRGLSAIASAHQLKIAVPVHPRTQKALKNAGIHVGEEIVLLPPCSFLEMVLLEKTCVAVVTDSGGVQKEAYFFRKPCLIMRPQTEWVELVKNGNALLSETNEMQMLRGIELLLTKKDYTWPAIFGDGQAAEFICRKILELFE